jgi:hypothetical protein
MKNKWCALRDSPDVRMVLKLRLKDFNQKELCEKLGVDYMNFRHYLDNSNPRGITQYDLWRLCGMVGMKVTVKIELQ